MVEKPGGDQLRDHFALHAPIGFAVAVSAYGQQPDLTDELDRTTFFAVWSALRYEWADQMLAEREVTQRPVDQPDGGVAASVAVLKARKRARCYGECGLKV